MSIFGNNLAVELIFYLVDHLIFFNLVGSFTATRYKSNV